MPALITARLAPISTARWTPDRNASCAAVVERRRRRTWFSVDATLSAPAMELFAVV